MLWNCIRAERLKLRRSHLWLVFLLIPILPTLMGAGNYLGNQAILTEGWYSLWTQHSLFYAGFFYGPLIAIYAAYLWRVEHLGHNWNHLMTMPVPEENIFCAKLYRTLRCTVLLQFWVFALYALAGKAVGLPGWPPFAVLFWLLRGSIGGCVIGALQLLLSMVIRSFAVPVGIALLGSILGFVTLSGGLGYLWPYALMAMGMNANSTADRLGNGAAFGTAVMAYLFLFTAAGILLLKKADVQAG